MRFQKKIQPAVFQLFPREFLISDLAVGPWAKNDKGRFFLRHLNEESVWTRTKVGNMSSPAFGDVKNNMGQCDVTSHLMKPLLAEEYHDQDFVNHAKICEATSSFWLSVIVLKLFV